MNRHASAEANETKEREGGGRTPADVVQKKLQIWACIAGFALAFLIYFHFIATTKQRQSLYQQIDGWRSEYHLTDEQAGHIRALEEDFHGSGNPFLRPAHTAAETSEYHLEIAAQMNPEDGAHYSRAQEGSPPSD